MSYTEAEKEHISSQVQKWAEYHEVDKSIVIAALGTIRDAVGSGYTIETYYGYGAADIINLYKQGVCDGEENQKGIAFHNQPKEDLIASEFIKAVGELAVKFTKEEQERLQKIKEEKNDKI